MSIAFCSINGHIIEKKVWFHVLCIFSSSIYTSELDTTELSILWVNSPISLCLSSCERCYSPYSIFVELLWTSMFMSLQCWGVQNWTHHSRCGLTRTWQRRKFTSLKLLAAYQDACLLTHRRILLTVFAKGTHCWLVFEFLSIRNPICFTKPAFQLSGPHSICWYLGLYLPRCRI